MVSQPPTPAVRVPVMTVKVRRVADVPILAAVTRVIAATRSYANWSRLAGLCAKASLVEGRAEAIWLLLVSASRPRCMAVTSSSTGLS